LPFAYGACVVKNHRDVLPLVLFELSVMRETVHRFGSAAGDDAGRLLAQLAVLESKAWRLLGVRNEKNRLPLDH
jgi:hypothetical protein